MKRRLQLMPEVLPAPTKVEATGPSAVRTRTMARLKALAAVGRPADDDATPGKSGAPSDGDPSGE